MYSTGKKGVWCTASPILPVECTGVLICAGKRKVVYTGSLLSSACVEPCGVEMCPSSPKPLTTPHPSQSPPPHPSHSPHPPPKPFFDSVYYSQRKKYRRLQPKLIFVLITPLDPSKGDRNLWFSLKPTAVQGLGVLGIYNGLNYVLNFWQFFV
jgi:hypothetical protein